MLLDAHPHRMVVQSELRDERGQQVSPPGMYAVPLPYADDIRQVRLDVAEAQRE
jgi:hypothetical protein